MKNIRNQRGDSIIEVVLAMTLLTLIIFTAWSMVNRSTQLSLSARKRVEMVNQLKEQAEIIKTIYADNQGDNITNFKSKVIDLTGEELGIKYEEEPPFCDEDATTGLIKAPPTNTSFHMAVDASASPPELKHVNGPKKVKGDAGSIVWVQWKKDSGKFIDFYIRGCWFTNGGVQQIDNAQFIVRLNYDK